MMGEFMREGGCRCGQVRFKISAPPLITLACHCTGCQKMTASAFSLSVLTRSAGFEVTQGEPVLGGLHGATRHFFCPHCKSWMFTRPDDAPHVVNVRTTLLDDPSGLEPFMETMTAEKLPWAVTPAVESFEGVPPPEAYAPMMAAFAAGRAG